MYAHYVSGKVKKVIISNNTRALQGKEIPVSGKVEARAVAAKYNAKPWNF